MARFIGMAVQKREVEICMVDPKGTVLKRSRCACDRETLTKLARKQFTKRDHVALETTTNAWAVADLIRPHVARVVVRNPVKTRIIADAKIKTDKVDAEVLAQLLRCNYLPQVWAPDVDTRMLRRLCSRRASLVASRIATKNRIHSLLGSLLIQAPLQDLSSVRRTILVRERRSSARTPRGAEHRSAAAGCRGSGDRLAGHSAQEVGVSR